MSTNEIFTKAFNAIKKTIPYQKEWSNGIGMHDYAVYGQHAPVIKRATAVKAITPNGRRLILIGTRLGNVVVFDRFSEQQHKDDAIFVHNATSAFSEGWWIGTAALTEGDLEILFGELHGDIDLEHNIGWRIEQLYSAMKKADAANS